MAIQREFKVKNGMAVRNTATFVSSDGIVSTSTDVITSLPTINLNFLNGTLDPRVAFNRASGATYIGKNGYIQYVGNDTPRFDYSSTSTGALLGLLIEDQRTNYFSYSSQFDNAAWTKFNCSILPNASVAPDGTFTAQGIIETVDATATYHTLPRTISGLTTGTYYTMSVYVSTTTNTPNINGFEISPINGSGSNWNLITKTLNFNYGNAINPTITDAGNGWTRLSTTVLVTATSITATLLTSTGATGLTNHTGTGALTTFIWGAQYEPGYFPSSYIPTFSSQTTRQGDYARMTGPTVSSAINPNAGTIYIEFDTITNGKSATGGNDFPIPYDFDNQNAQSDGYWMLLSAGYGPGLSLNIPVTGVSNQSISIATPLGDLSIKKFATAFQKNDMAAVLNGASVQTVTNVTVLPTGIDRITIGSQSYVGANGNYLTGHVRKLSYYPTRLSNTQIQTLTSSTAFSNTNFAGVISPNTHLGTTSNFTVREGLIVPRNLEVPDADKLYITNLTRPTQQPSLNLNFLKGTLDPRISFTRASGATVVGRDGLIKYVGNDIPRINYSSTSTGTCLGLLIEEQRTNLLSNSTKFSVWNNNTNLPIFDNSMIAPDGTMTAAITNSTGGGTRYTGTAPATSGTAYTYSIYFNPQDPTKTFRCYVDGNIGAGNTFSSASVDVVPSTRSVTLSSLASGGLITPVGNGWYRMSVTFTPLSNQGMNCHIYPIDSTLTGWWGAQTEQGTFPTSFIPTTSAAATRAVDLAIMNGQNLQSWFNMNQGTLYLEADTITSSVDSANSFRWACSLSLVYGQKIGFYKIYNSSNLLPKIADDQYVSRFEPLLGPISTSTIFKAALSYSSGKQFASLNYVNTVSGTSVVMPQFIDNLRIGNGDACWCGHIRRLVYYPEQLANTATQALTAI